MLAVVYHEALEQSVYIVRLTSQQGTCPDLAPGQGTNPPGAVGRMCASNVLQNESKTRLNHLE